MDNLCGQRGESIADVHVLSNHLQQYEPTAFIKCSSHKQIEKGWVTIIQCNFRWKKGHLWCWWVKIDYQFTQWYVIPWTQRVFTDAFSRTFFPLVATASDNNVSLGNGFGVETAVFMLFGVGFSPPSVVEVPAWIPGSVVSSAVMIWENKISSHCIRFNYRYTCLKVAVANH